MTRVGVAEPHAHRRPRQAGLRYTPPFQLLFDFLAFKNDISFWRKKKSMMGMSTRAGRRPWGWLTRTQSVCCCQGRHIRSSL